jgi:hypothetical protein
MSKFHEMARGGSQNVEEAYPWFETLSTVFPEVAAVLKGDPGSPPETPPVEGMSIIISVYQGALQFVLSRKGDPEMWAGPIDASEGLIEGVEMAIRQGRLSKLPKRGDGPRQKRQ